METSFDYTEKGRGWFSSDEKKWINKIRKLKEQHPDKVNILKQPEENDGCIYCTLPPEWFRLQVKIKRELSEEQRLAASERLRAVREKQLNK